VLDLHPLFSSLPVQFHGLLLDAEDLLLVALHDEAVSRVVLSLGELKGAEGHQVSYASQKSQAGFKDLHGSFGGLNVHRAYYNTGWDKCSPTCGLSEQDVVTCEFAPMKDYGRSLVLHWNDRQMRRRGIEKPVLEKLASHLAHPARKVT
jgi:hypothetical protein